MQSFCVIITKVTLLGFSNDIIPKITVLSDFFTVADKKSPVADNNVKQIVFLHFSPTVTINQCNRNLNWREKNIMRFFV